MLENLRDVLSRRPFEPFRVVLSSGSSYEIRHPEFGWLVRGGLYVGIPAASNSGVPDQAVFCSMLHITAIEPLESASAN